MADDKAKDGTPKDGTPTGKVSITPTAKLDKTIPGGRYINAMGKRVNAHGQAINEEGNVTDGSTTPTQPAPH